MSYAARDRTEGGTVLQLLATQVEEAKRRVVVVYRNALLRDLLNQALLDGGVAVVAVIAEDELDGSTLLNLNPDVIVFDDATAEFVRAACQAIVFSRAAASTKKVIVVARNYLVTVTYTKEILQDASIDDLVFPARDWHGIEEER